MLSLTRQLSSTSSAMYSDADSEYMYESDDDDMVVVSEPVVSKPLIASLDTDELFEFLRSSFAEFNDVTCANNDGVAVMHLRKCGWQSEDATMSYFSTPRSDQKKKKKTKKTCDICTDSGVELFAFSDCEHKYCLDCWKGYLTVEIESGGGLFCKCMGYKCNQVIDRGFAIKHLGDNAELMEKFTRFTLNDLVKSHPLLAWCPNNACDLVVRSDSKFRTEISCKCGTKFCFACLHDEVHVPVTCEVLQDWFRKEKGDGMTLKWIASNTKDCPKCKGAIEKNGGCNHMTCRNCSHEFCWLCSKPWRSHESCNKFAQTEGISDVRAEVERYQHYWGRYMAHMESQKLESQLRSTAQKRISAVYRTGVLKLKKRSGKSLGSKNVDTDTDSDDADQVSDSESYRAKDIGRSMDEQQDQFAETTRLRITQNDSSWVGEGERFRVVSEALEQATDSLLNCRKVLKFAYVHAYFLPKDSAELNLLEFLQKELEASTEDLSFLIESKPVSEMMDNGQQMKDAVHSANSRLRSLIEGLTKDGGLTSYTG